MAEAELNPTEQFSKMSREIIDPIQALPLKERAPKYESAMAVLVPQQIQAAVNLEKAKSDRDIGVKQAGAEEGQRQTILQQNEMEAGLAKRDKHVMPTFTPTQEDLGTYAQLASSIATMGLLIGAGGKSSAKIAIASMTGMLKGWKEGRRDLYERESKNFEKESARISNIRKDIQNDLNMAMRLWPTKRKDAIDLIETARYKAGTESVLGAMLYKGNYDGAMKLLESARKLDEVRLKDEEKREAARVKAASDAAIAKARIASNESIAGRRIASSEAIAKARNKIEQDKSDDANRRQMFRLEAEKQAKIRAEDAKAKTSQNAKGKDERPLATTIDLRVYGDLKDQERAWTRMKEKLSDDKFQKSFDDIGMARKLFIEPVAGEGPLALITRAISATTAEKTRARDPELINFLQDIIQLRNTYYRYQSGQAVTGGEAARNFFVTAQPIDSAKVLMQKIDRAKDQISSKKLDMESSYRNINLRPTPIQTPGVAKQMPSGDKLSEYATQHFEGNKDKAIQYLQSQGFK
jgi:hypothetical protein